MYKHTFTHINPYTYKYTYICTAGTFIYYTCMYAHTHIHIYTYISQHVDPPNINALCVITKNNNITHFIRYIYTITIVIT